MKLPITKSSTSKSVSNLLDAGKFFQTFNVDGLDQSKMLGTRALSPGGLDWKQIVACFGKILKKENDKG